MLSRPLEDSGSQTQDRYTFQHHCTARRGITLLASDTIQAIVCEWHEDYVVMYVDGSTELVSVKHLESSQSRWTIQELCTDGGLKHLFQRWRETGRRSRSCLETNAGMRTGAGESAELVSACSRRDATDLQSWAPRLAPHLGDHDDLDEIAQFLASLAIDHGLPSREHIRDQQINSLMRPALQSIGFPIESAAAAYDAVVSEVAAANRARPGDFNALRLLANIDRLSAEAELMRDLAQRTIDRRRLLSAIASLNDPLRPLLLPGQASEPTAMVKKLTRGGIGPSALNDAKRLRSTWLRLRKTWSKDLPGEEPEFEDLASQVLHIAQQAETATRGGGGAYGAAMLQEVERRLKVDLLRRRPALPVLDEHLLGLVYQLTEDCLVWWSDPFEVSAAS